MRQTTPIFRGIATALVTPTTPTGIDYDAFARLIDWQIAQGINALVICGTTGESSTLTDAEHRRAIAFACEHVAGRVPVIAGTGSNETDYAVELTRSACADGADAVLVVTPYYNKTTQRGLIRMYETIADASTKPLILYNVPSRTGINIAPETYVALAEHPRIAAIKEANSDISKIVETFALVGDRLDIYSGNDDQIVPILAMGGQGCISVLSNVIPAQTVSSPGTSRARPRCNVSTCRSCGPCSARRTPSPSRPPWPPWATVRTTSVCRWCRWRRTTAA